MRNLLIKDFFSAFLIHLIDTLADLSIGFGGPMPKLSGLVHPSLYYRLYETLAQTHCDGLAYNDTRYYFYLIK